MQLQIENKFLLPSDRGGFKSITLNKINYLNNDDLDENHLTFKISDNFVFKPKIINDINKDLWLMFIPKYPLKGISNTMIVIKLIFLGKYSIEVYLLLTVTNSNKLFLHITNVNDYYYIRSNNKFLISTTDRGVEPSSIADIYSHYHMIYTNNNNSISNVDFFPSIQGVKGTFDNTSELSIALSIYPNIATAQINEFKMKKEILYNIIKNNKDNTLCYHSECLLDLLLDRLNESGILTKINTLNKSNSPPPAIPQTSGINISEIFEPFVNKIFKNKEENKEENDKEEKDENDEEEDDEEDEEENEQINKIKEKIFDKKKDELSFSFKIRPKEK